MRLIALFLLAAAIGPAISPARAQTPDLAQIGELAADGRCAQAFEILAPLEFEMAGIAEFDLLFAHCALELGETGLAMLALERVLAVAPASTQARFLLARAYFLLDDFEAARREFELLLSLGPAPVLGDSVGQYLDAIAARHPRDGLRVGGYVAFGVGHDSNVTDGTANDLIYFPGLNQDFRPAASDREDADDYANLAAGIDLVRPIGRRHGVYAGADVNARRHRERDALDYELTSLRAGYRHAWHNHSLRAGLGLVDWRLDGAAYQDGESLEIEWRNVHRRRNQFGLAAGYARYRHDAAADAVLDYDDTRLRLAYTRLLGPRGDQVLGVSVAVGREDDVNGRDDGNRDTIALRIHGQLPFSEQTNGFLIISSQSDDYDRENPLFAERRSESRNQVAAGVIWQIRESTSLAATLVASDTDSNFALYDSSSNDFSITLRQDFF